MHLRTSRRRWSVLTVVGCCLGVYVVLAVGFRWFVEPTMGKSYAAYAPPTYSPPAAAPAVPTVAPEPHRRVSAAFAALPVAKEQTAEQKTTDVAPKDSAKKHAAHLRHERSGRQVRGPWDFAASLFSGSRRWF